MKIEAENIFQVMRLVLPEHRGAMSRYQTAQACRKKPTLGQQEWEEMSYTISDALETESPVRVTLFGPLEDEVWEGVPVMYAEHLHLVINGERRRLPVERLIDVTTTH